MASQQQMGMGQMGLAQHLAYCNQYQQRIIGDEMAKAYIAKSSKKKLLLLRK